MISHRALHIVYKNGLAHRIITRTRKVALTPPTISLTASTSMHTSNRGPVPHRGRQPKGTRICELNSPILVTSWAQRGVASHKDDMKGCLVLLVCCSSCCYESYTQTLKTHEQLCMPAHRSPPFLVFDSSCAIISTSFFHPAWKTRTLYLKTEIQYDLGHMFELETNAAFRVWFEGQQLK